MTSGRASWYGYKGGNFAASPDFPKGSKLRVYNIENNKFVDVEINDYGPDRSLHPDRAIDLDKVAFAQIASLGEGIIDVKIEPLLIAKENGMVLGVSETGIGAEPEITASSAVIINGETGEVLFGKDINEQRSIASLSKLIAMKVFFDLNPDLSQVVSYSKQDEEYNYEYCSIWESARIRLKEGDQLTLEDLAYSALVGSANNAIETLVRYSGLERDAFIDKMNTYVYNLGATSTKFVEPTGLSPENVSSAQDYAIIMKDAISHPLLKKISATAKYEFTTINTKEKHTLRNTNHLARYDERITGSKTGYLDEADYCLASEYQTDNGPIITVILGAKNREISFLETENLYKFGSKLNQ